MKVLPNRSNMGNSFFRFKQFGIYQDRCAMKVSTDAVLLGALAECRAPRRILDIGTGTGVLGLMAAQRFPEAGILAIEMDGDAAEQARANMSESPWSERMKVHRGRFQDFWPTTDALFDLIVTNPPYFHAHLLSHDTKRNTALHQGELPFEDLIAGVTTMLSPVGTFWVILPPQQMNDLQSIAYRYGLRVYSEYAVFDKEGKPMLRKLQGFCRAGNKMEGQTDTIFIKDNANNYTSRYRSLLADFMLHF